MAEQHSKTEKSILTPALPKVFIFGAGAVGQYVLRSTRKRYQMIAFLDNDESKWGNDVDGFPVCDPKLVLETDYDMIIIASPPGLVTITEQLLGLGVSRNKICTEYVDFSVKSRIVFLEKLGALFHEQNIRGCMAECGVFQGEFSRSTAGCPVRPFDGKIGYFHRHTRKDIFVKSSLHSFVEFFGASHHIAPYSDDEQRN